MKKTFPPSPVVKGLKSLQWEQMGEGQTPHDPGAMAERVLVVCVPVGVYVCVHEPGEMPHPASTFGCQMLVGDFWLASLHSETIQSDHYIRGGGEFIWQRFREKK